MIDLVVDWLALPLSGAVDHAIESRLAWHGRLMVLAWAVEEADPGVIAQAVENWLGLKPEERWWLYTMTNAATGHALTGRGKGWRKALRYALTENPVSEGLMQRRLSEFELVPNTGNR